MDVLRWTARDGAIDRCGQSVFQYLPSTIRRNGSRGASTTGLAPLPAYAASGGLYSYGAGTQMLYRFNPQWEARTFVEYERLTGSAADSPLVTQRGSANQLTYGLGASYSFDMHPWW